MSGLETPNPVAVAWSVIRSMITVRSPGPFGDAEGDSDCLGAVLARLRSGGIGQLVEMTDELDDCLRQQAPAIPNRLTSDAALAHWINLYNTGALSLAARARERGEESVLGVPAGFSAHIVTVGGERLSLDDIEHGKLRRFQDPRVHGALVCGSVSCPTLRYEPYSGRRLSEQLDDQLRHFLRSGAYQADEANGVVRLSRIFLWFGADFVRPARMPSFLPVRKRAVLESLTPWLDEKTALWVEATRPEVRFQHYDWGLSCTVRQPADDH